MAAGFRARSSPKGDLKLLHYSTEVSMLCSVMSCYVRRNTHSHTGSVGTNTMCPLTPMGKACALLGRVSKLLLLLHLTYVSC